jgi:hypothetical protein
MVPRVRSDAGSADPVDDARVEAVWYRHVIREGRLAWLPICIDVVAVALPCGVVVGIICAAGIPGSYNAAMEKMQVGGVVGRVVSRVRTVRV